MIFYKVLLKCRIDGKNPVFEVQTIWLVLAWPYLPHRYRVIPAANRVKAHAALEVLKCGELAPAGPATQRAQTTPLWLFRFFRQKLNQHHAHGLASSILVFHLSTK
ncbi:hypothetical protein OH492_10740 [Vibrio chagasii]|nr:hypothetical protein [Vibrio chagasii]